MGQNVIYPHGPLFMVDRSWKTSHRDLGVKIVPFGKDKLPQNTTRRGPRHGPAISLSGCPAVEQASLERASAGADSAQKPELMGASTQNFQFVNVAGSFSDRGIEVRQLVRSHVMKGTRRTQKPRRKTKEERTSPLNKAEILSAPLVGSDSETDSSTSIDIAPVLPGSATSFYGVSPCLMKPHFYGLLNYYLFEVSRSLYPMDSHLAFNPVKASWFPLAIADELLLHTVLFSAAVTLSFVKEQRQSTEASDIMRPIFRLLTSRLEDKSEISDATIGAVSCLAMVETMSGNHAKWKVHATGLAEMVRTRGGMSSIDPGLQMKICRADIEGAVDSVSAPQLPMITRSHPPIFSIVQATKALQQDNGLLHLLSSSNVSPELRTTLLDLARFSQAMEYAFSRPEVSLHPNAFDEDVISIQHQLLSVPKFAQRDLDVACRLGALIYMKTLAREMPVCPPSSTLIVAKLKRSLTRIADEPGAAPLLLWLYFMGGIASYNRPTRFWFTEKIVEFVLLPDELLTWVSVKKALRKVLWIELIHEGPCKQLWDETEIVRAMSIQQS